MTIMSVTAVARASALLASVLMMAAGAESGARKPGIDPLSALDNNDLVDLLDMELDEVFLLPKTTLQDGHHRHRPHLSEKESNAFKRHHRPHHRHNNNGSKNNKRNLQEEDREESMFSSPSPTVGSLSRGVSSSYMTDSWPSSAPTAAPTMGSGSRGGLFGSESPTASPTAGLPVDRGMNDGDDEEEEEEGDDGASRETAAAPRRYGGGSCRFGGFASGVTAMAMTTAVVTMMMITM